jgi:hypothetical protein
LRPIGRGCTADQTGANSFQPTLRISLTNSRRCSNRHGKLDFMGRGSSQPVATNDQPQLRGARTVGVEATPWRALAEADPLAFAVELATEYGEELEAAIKRATPIPPHEQQRWWEHFPRIELRRPKLDGDRIDISFARWQYLSGPTGRASYAGSALFWFEVEELLAFAEDVEAGVVPRLRERAGGASFDPGEPL